MGVDSELREALVNLVFNAVDSMPEGGTLTLRTRSDARDPEPPGEHDQRWVHVEVTDTGVGMDEETRRQCLEPFFTTKGERGTGLGLAMVYGAIERHRGEIDIVSAPGAGTTVRLTLPVPSGAALAVEPSEPLAGLPSRFRILVVDDDPLVLKSLQDALEGEGHVVHAANQGQVGIDAFRAARGRGERFDVVITDLGMPKVDGRQVAAAVKADSPSTPVLLLTGWGQRLVAEGDIPAHVDQVLSKPPRMPELRRALARHCGASRI
jgi:CheY-like chemotaxis protein/anti-sigma regulatory factor (Ser/Thr protein kinase)